jgi:hypothetical protein
MIASDPIRTLRHLLQAGGRPHMGPPVKPDDDNAGAGTTASDEISRGDRAGHAGDLEQEIAGIGEGV